MKPEVICADSKPIHNYTENNSNNNENFRRKQNLKFIFRAKGQSQFRYEHS